MNHIHQTAIISPKAKIGSSVMVGAYCVIDDMVEIADNVEVKSHVCISGRTKIAANTKIYPFASIGYAPQDLKYHGEQAVLIIGVNCFATSKIVGNNIFVGAKINSAASLPV
jgi:UDP-N-acetylglucosamine acyltransferase